MNFMPIEELVFANQKVLVEDGELVSYTVDGHEFIHQKGSPGWRNADTEMFPIIGPTNEADFQVETSRGKAVQDQHGLLREIDYELKTSDLKTVTYQKKYNKNRQVANSKYPEKSTAQILSWPYGFTFQKSFALTEAGLEISFKVMGEEGMPFMLGYHPAFKLHTETSSIEANENIISLQEVLAVGSRALQVADCENILLKDKKNLSIKTEGFGNFMLWTEVPNMVCIEPITFYPYAVKANELQKGFQMLNAKSKVFKVCLIPR